MSFHGNVTCSRHDMAETIAHLALHNIRTLTPIRPGFPGFFFNLQLQLFFSIHQVTTAIVFVSKCPAIQ